jgi:hypothetical protein
MLQMEKQLRESGAFEQVLRNSEAPDTRGYQEFVINATAVRPTYTVAFPEAQDFARTSMRVRRYGPPPDDVDAVASGLDARTTTTPSSASRSTKASDTTAGAAEAARSDGAVADASGADDGDGDGDGDAKTGNDSGRQVRGSGRGKSSAGTPFTPSTTTGSGAADAATTDATNAAAANTEPADATTTDAGATAAAGADSKSAARGARAAGSATRGGLATRGNIGGSSEVEPPPPVLSENEIKRMSREEAREALVKVSRARQRADLDDAVKTRLKTEFDLLLERCKHE